MSAPRGRDAAGTYAAVGTLTVGDGSGAHTAADEEPDARAEVTAGATLDPGGVKAALRHYLTNLRGALVWKLEGLSEREARWPRTPTGTNLLGLVKHVASNEAEYFGVVFDRPFGEPMPWLSDAAEDNDDLYAAPEESVASVLAFADRAWAHADATIASLPLDAPGRVPWWASETNEVTRRDPRRREGPRTYRR